MLKNTHMMFKEKDKGMKNQCSLTCVKYIVKIRGVNKKVDIKITKNRRSKCGTSYKRVKRSSLFEVDPQS